MKKANTKEDKKLAKSKQDFCVYLTKSINSTVTTTPMDPGKDFKCVEAKNYVTKIIAHTDKLLANQSGKLGKIKIFLKFVLQTNTVVFVLTSHLLMLGHRFILVWKDY